MGTYEPSGLTSLHEHRPRESARVTVSSLSGGHLPNVAARYEQLSVYLRYKNTASCEVRAARGVKAHPENDGVTIVPPPSFGGVHYGT